MIEVRSAEGVDDFLPSLPTDVYVARDKPGTVLYVGMTGSLGQRMQTHSVTSSWWGSMATLEVERLPNRLAAAQREAQLIDELNPVHNRTNDPAPWKERDDVVLTLCHLGLSQVDIAWELDVSIGAVRGCTSRLRRQGRLHLRPQRARRKPTYVSK